MPNQIGEMTMKRREILKGAMVLATAAAIPAFALSSEITIERIDGPYLGWDFGQDMGSSIHLATLKDGEFVYERISPEEFFNLKGDWHHSDEPMIEGHGGINREITGI